MDQSPVQVDAATDGFSLKGPGWTNPLSKLMQQLMDFLSKVLDGPIPYHPTLEDMRDAIGIHRPHILNLSTCEC